MIIVTATGFTFVSWWQSCCVRGRAGRPDHEHSTTVKPEAVTAIIELLMMGGKTSETCWAVNKRQDNKLENCCVCLVIYLNCTKKHGLTNLKFINWLVFITEMKSVYSAVRTGSLNKAVRALSLKGCDCPHTIQIAYHSLQYSYAASFSFFKNDTLPCDKPGWVVKTMWHFAPHSIATLASC
jgi:hypothetical protein